MKRRKQMKSAVYEKKRSKRETISFTAAMEIKDKHMAAVLKEMKWYCHLGQTDELNKERPKFLRQYHYIYQAVHKKWNPKVKYGQPINMLFSYSFSWTTLFSTSSKERNK